ncbi:hypothetical protein [Microlunatus ginsengisoli]|uniref:Uncharacterized protein n=1 Tax=Microlunatus ginsengisoli TaxID=363863 RepID=A0ABP7AYV6_9ACTN
MRVDDFFTESEVPVRQADPWGLGTSTTAGTRNVQHFNHEMMNQLRQARLGGWAHTEVAVALCRLVHGELEAYGTGGSEKLTEDGIAIAIRALVVTKRLGVDFDPPYRNFTSFRSCWMRNDGYGSYQARRDLLSQLFDPLYMRLLRLEEATFEALLDPVSPRAEVGWPAVDEEIRELRRRFQNATTAQDHKDVGLRCVTVTELLGDAVYEPANMTWRANLPRPEATPRIGSSATSGQCWRARTTLRLGRWPERS